MLDPRFEADCAEVVRLIEPTNTSPWLTDYFVHWSSPLASEWSVASLQPTKAQMKKKLLGLIEAAGAVNEVLSDPVTKGFLELTHGFAVDEKFPGLSASLRALLARYLKDPQRAAREGAAARIHAERTYAAPVVAKLIEGLLDEAIASRAARTRAR